MRRLPRFLSLLGLIGCWTASEVSGQSTAVSDLPLPEVLLPNWEIERVASAPELVTPVGCVIDDGDGLLVIESHTHFPSDDYEGPKTDRIYRFVDSDGNGSRDRQMLFYEGGSASMGLAVMPDGWIAIATRGEVVKIRDADGDGHAEQKQPLLTLQTEATYPHNGLGGLAWHADGWLYVGQGENLGEPYRLVATDGSSQSGGGEGGNVFRIRSDGSTLQRIATGFWNPFSLHFDSAGRLWTVGNDPDAMPPCRLLHVLEGGDYGFQFRFGRAGTHPLQAWDGELPGTLPMASGTGEAPCAVIEHAGWLWVTSWGSNRIERYRLHPRGASVTAEMEIVVQGGPSFRPVGLAVDSNGSLFITDWVDRSYPVHGRGGLWRLTPSASVDEVETPAVIPERSREEKLADNLLHDPDLPSQQRLAALDDDDPFIRHAATIGLVNHDQLQGIRRGAANSARQRLGLLLGWHWRALSDPDAVSDQSIADWIRWGLSDSSADVALAAVRWACERNDASAVDPIRAILKRREISSKLFAGAVAAIAYLETGSAKAGLSDPACEQLLYQVAADTDRATDVRALAISMLPADATRPNHQELAAWVDAAEDRRFGGEIVRLLVARDHEDATAAVARIAEDPSIHEQVRADAIAGLSRHAASYSRLLNQAALPSRPAVIRQEAQRVLRRVRNQGVGDYPAPDDLAAWTKLAVAGGDVQAGRRVFYRTTCANCHTHNGRGSSVGPDLGQLTGHMDQARLVESILLPSREVAPLYVTWQVLTIDGRVLTGMKLDRGGTGGSVRFLGAEGGVFEVPLEEIQSQRPVKPSIMPAGLEQTMSLDEFRDLIAFLHDPGW